MVRPEDVDVPAGVYTYCKGHFCGCGSPLSATRALRDLLGVFAQPMSCREEPDVYISPEAYKKLVTEKYAGDEGPTCLMLYWMHVTGLLEHSGSVNNSSSLTPLGYALKKFLEKYPDASLGKMDAYNVTE